VIYKIFNGYWFFGRPTVEEPPAGPARRNQEILAELLPPTEETLLTPIYVAGKAGGTVWLIAHDAARKFDIAGVGNDQVVRSVSSCTARGQSNEQAPCDTGRGQFA